MGYYDDPYGGYEPTEEDYCEMQAHLTGPDEQDPDGGWYTCFCRHLVKPPFPEPHDEYSAFHADLRDEYISLVLTNFKNDIGILVRETNRDAQVFDLHRKLSKLSIDQLQELVAITRSSNQHCYDHTLNPEDILAIGVHLDKNGHAIVSTIIAESISEGDLARKWVISSGSYAETLVDSDHRSLARVTAQFCYLLKGSPFSFYNDEKQKMVEFVRTINRQLEQQPEKMQGIAALVNANGVSPETTQLAVAILNGEVEATASALCAGLL